MFKEWLQEHPVETLDFSAPLYPPAKDRAFWADKAAPAIIAEAEEYLSYTWPQAYATDFIAYRTEGSRVRQEKPHFARRSALCTLLKGELAEYEGRFLPDIVNGLFAICEETYWGLSAHYKDKFENYKLPDARYPYIDLFAAETAALLAVAYDLLHQELHAFCPEILARLEYEMERRIVSPYLDHLDAWWMGQMGRTVNNWTPWILSNLLTVFLTMEKRPALFEAGMKKMFREMDYYYNVQPLDGGCDEGCCYWAVAGATVFEFCEQLYVASKGAIDFFGDEKLRNIGKYIRRVYIGNHYFANFADGTPRQTHALAGILYPFGKRINDAGLMDLAKEFLDQEPAAPEVRRDAKVKRALAEMIYTEEMLTRPDYTTGGNHALESIQNAFARKGNWYYAAKGGHNRESHNHNDVGSFIAYWSNTPVLVDPSCGTYTAQTFSDDRYSIWCMQSAWHNLPMINGITQPFGREYCAEHFSFRDQTARLSFAQAYPPEAGVEKICRSLAFGEQGIALKDSFVFDKEANELREHFVTPLEIQIEKDRAVLGGRFVLACDTGAEITADRMDFADDPKLVKGWGQDHLNRICFRFAAGKETEINFTLTEM